MSALRTDIGIARRPDGTLVKVPGPAIPAPQIHAAALPQQQVPAAMVPQPRVPGPAVQQARQHAYQLTGAETAAIQGLVTSMADGGIYDAGHVERLLRLVRGVAEELGATEQVRHDVSILAMVHDIGKLGTPRAVLEKREALNADERRLLTRHPVVGGEMLSGLPALATLAYLHTTQHERWDGSGYPLGLRGEQIPLASRIISVCNGYLAMTEDRPYRSGLPAAMANEIVERNAGSQFCPTAARALITVVRRASVVVPLTTGAFGIAPSPEVAAREAAVRAREAAARVEQELAQQLHGRAVADGHGNPATRGFELPLWCYMTVILIGLTIGVMLALPLPSAHHLCGAGAQARQCQLDKIWLPAIEKIFLGPIAAVLILFIASHLPSWLGSAIHGESAPKAKPGRRDMLEAAASWGLAMQDAGIGDARTFGGPAH